mgnify:CR=1 FL=1
MILSSKDSDRLDILYELGGSSGGTRPKILLREDGEDWIVKFPAKKDPAISGKSNFQDEDMMTVGKNAGLQKKFCSEALRQVKEGINDLESYLSRKALPGSAKVSWIDRLEKL